MQAAHPNPFTRDDTMLGICQAIGDDLGFNPTILRAAFAIPLVMSPMVAAGIYLSLGVAVLVSRLLVPEPRRARVSTVEPAVENKPAPAQLHAENETVADVLAVAA